MIHSRIAVLNLGMAANIISLTALIGHAADAMALASWGGAVPLSIPGAVIGLCLGFAVTLIALHDRVWRHD